MTGLGAMLNAVLSAQLMNADALRRAEAAHRQCVERQLKALFEFDCAEIFRKRGSRIVICGRAFG